MKLILDCDAGADDALALMLLCESAHELLGVSTCFGGYCAEKAAEQAHRILTAAGTAIPVCVGANCALVRKQGPVHLDYVPEERASQDAASFLCKLLQNEEPVCILATGPLTNIAAMLRKTKRKPERIFIMGGGMHGGNRTPYAEFNFYCDPEAANEVLQSGCPITLLPLEAAEDCGLSVTDAEGLCPEAGDFLLSQLEFSKSRGCSTADRVIAYDAVAAAGCLDPAVFAKTRLCSCRVNCTQTAYAGQLLLCPEPGNVTLVEQADRDAFLRCFSVLQAK